MPADPLQHAAKLHRRWRGLGPVLLVAFYSYFFALHLKFEKSALYLKNDAVLSADTASFYNDLLAPAAQAGAQGTGKDDAFLLLHHFPTSVFNAVWGRFSGSPGAARQHAMATLTASAGALTVMLLYLTLMWSGVGRLRAVLLGGILGGSTAVTLFSVLPQPQIFSVLGLTAALAAVARARSAAWWEFPAAALYAACCSLLNVVPLFFLALVRAVRNSLGGGGVRPLWGMLVSMCLLVLLTLGAARLQGWMYPRSEALSSLSLVERPVAALKQAWAQTPGVNWKARAQDALFVNLAAPSGMAQAMAPPAPGADKRVVALADDGWLSLDFQDALWAVWLALLLLGLAGLPMALRSAGGTMLAALFLAGWLIWFYGALQGPGERLLYSALGMPAVVFLVGVGAEQHVQRWAWLRWPLALLLGAFLVLQLGRNHLFMVEIARSLAL